MQQEVKAAVKAWVAPWSNSEGVSTPIGDDQNGALIMLDPLHGV